MGRTFAFILALLSGALSALSPYAAHSQQQVGFTQIVQQATPVVLLSSAPPSLHCGASATLTATLTGGGAPPSGTVTFRNGASVLGSATLNSNGIATFPIGPLAPGSYPIVAAYSGDANYRSALSAPLALAAACLVPSVAITPGLPRLNTAQKLPVVVTVNVSPGNPPATGSIVLTGSISAPPPALLKNGLTEIDLPPGALPIGTDTLTATYAPDAASALIYTSASNSAQVVVSAAPAFTLAGSPITLEAGRMPGNTATITITPQPGFTGSVELAAKISSAPPGAINLPTLSFGTTSPVSITSGNPANATLTIATAVSAESAQAQPAERNKALRSDAGALLACLLFLCIPVRRRQCRPKLATLLLLLLAASAGLGGCGGYTYLVVGPPTTLGTYTVTVTGTSGQSTATATFPLTVR